MSSAAAFSTKNTTKKHKASPKRHRLILIYINIGAKVFLTLLKTMLTMYNRHPTTFSHDRSLTGVFVFFLLVVLKK